jgi:hypothetical protein
MTDTDIDWSNEPDVVMESKIPVVSATAVPYGFNNADTMNPSNQQQPPIPPVLQPSLITSFSTSNVMTNEAIQTLRNQGFPMGLAQELGNTRATYPLRFWIVDNSGYVIVFVWLLLRRNRLLLATVHIIQLQNRVYK